MNHFENISIAEIRDKIDTLRWTRDDLHGHTRDEFKRADVRARLTPKIAAVESLIIPERFAREKEKQKWEVDKAKEMIQRHESEKKASTAYLNSNHFENGRQKALSEIQNAQGLIFGKTWDDIQDMQQKRYVPQYIDTSKKGDYGADPLGNGKFKMVPSGDIVDLDERNKRLKK